MFPFLRGSAAPYLLKALRLVKQNREIAMDAIMKSSEAGRDSPRVERSEALEQLERS
jgi:hypothetical protein